MSLKPSGVQGALNGIVVADLTHVLAGPFCTMLLAELGARVIKVERPGAGDLARRLQPVVNGRSAYFCSINRGKEGILLDLKSSRDRPTFHRLLAHSDVLVENFTPGTMDRLGFGWDSLHERHPHLVYASISGFGRTGPYKGRKVNDLVAQAMGGIMSLTGPEGGPPMRTGTAIGDMGSGVFAVAGICAALYEREKSGEGRLVDISMVDCQVAQLEHNIARYSVTGEVPACIGNRHPALAPFGVYESADGRMTISSVTDRDFRVLAELIGRPELPDDPRFGTMEDRAANAHALDSIIGERMRLRTTAEWLEILLPAEMRVAPIQSVADVVQDPQIRARNMVVTAEDPGLGEVSMQGNPIKMPFYPDPPIRKPAPEPGEHTERVLSELEREP